MANFEEMKKRYLLEKLKSELEPIPVAPEEGLELEPNLPTIQEVKVPIQLNPIRTPSELIKKYRGDAMGVRGEIQAPKTNKLLV